MDITIQNEEYRFGCRAVAIIFNNNMSKVLVQKIKDIYMLPGGRLHILEDSKSAIERELREELNINEPVKLKYCAESFIAFPNGQKYHELEYYYLVKIDEKKYKLENEDKILNNDKNEDKILNNDKNDDNIFFEWIKISNIDNYNLIPKNIIEKLKDIKSLENNIIEHLIYKEI